MAERHISEYVILKLGAQQAFIEEVMEKSGLGASELAERLIVSGRSVRDWRREKCKMSLDTVKQLARVGGIKMPGDIALYDRQEQLRRASVLGGRAMVAKYGRVGGDEQKRKDAWRTWWSSEGKYKPSKILYKRKSIRFPRESAKVAEFFGIVMGDGGISPRQITVTLHSETDKEFAGYYAGLCYELFGVRPTVSKVKSSKALVVVISRTDLVQWCHTLGLPIGNKIKQGLDVPKWIKRNPAYARACLRGLVDTDGSVFKHKYRVGGKQYEYKKLDFCTLSSALLKSAYIIFRANGMSPYVRPGKILRLESQKDVARYFKIIGTSNPKHLRRYLE